MTALEKIESVVSYLGVDDIQKVFSLYKWESRDVSVEENGEVVFEKHGVEFPDFWSDTACTMTTKMYFRKLPSGDEMSFKSVVMRVCNTIADSGVKQGYFGQPQDKDLWSEKTTELRNKFAAALAQLLIEQRLAFNSPVFFNVGIQEKPQCSACFILQIDDNLIETEFGILNTLKTEGVIFRNGSGSGMNMSTLRSSYEKLSRGGYSSGPVSFMQGFDSVAGMIKSGGTTRRAAKMVILNMDHPDIYELRNGQTGFIGCKALEEKKGKWLAKDTLGQFDVSFDGDVRNKLQYQNANNSVRVSDAFMHAVEADGMWATREVATGKVVKEYKARVLYDAMVTAIKECGDPGIQFDDTFNKWNTVKASGKLTATNPCSEYSFLNNSACNLASHNLAHFDVSKHTDAYENVVEMSVLAQDIIVEMSSYPTEAIERNTYDFRTLGCGYANLGTVLMLNGLPYDSVEGRELAAQITNRMTGIAYRMSTYLAELLGPFKMYSVNKESMHEILYLHSDVDNSSIWQEVLARADIYGVRNAQVTLLAPTGTISLMMDCFTTGCEPLFSLVTYKKLAGKGTLKLINHLVEQALRNLSYNSRVISEISQYINEHDTIVGSSLDDEHLAIFQTAVGENVISPEGHIKMLAAIQPSLSGAISKTVNLSRNCSTSEIDRLIMLAWKSGVKAIALYPDGCKDVQPLSHTSKIQQIRRLLPHKNVQRKMPKFRYSHIHEFSLSGLKGWVDVGFFDEDMEEVGEIWVRMKHFGSTIEGLLNAFAMSISYGLQYGVPLEKYVEEFKDMSFEPSGLVDDEDVRMAPSIIAYIFRRIGLSYLDSNTLDQLELYSRDIPHQKEDLPKQSKLLGSSLSGNICTACGTIMRRVGTCEICPSCFKSSGGCS